jgi:hypothetical protein
MIEIFEDITNGIFTVSTVDGSMHEFESELDAILKAQELCNCNDDFLIMPLFEDDEL